MKCIIADAGPIIALCKINQFKLVTQLFNPCFVTKAVYDEVIAGSDSAVTCIQQAVELNQVTVKSSNTITSDLLKILDNGYIIIDNRNNYQELTFIQSDKIENIVPPTSDGSITIL